MKQKQKQNQLINNIFNIHLFNHIREMVMIVLHPVPTFQQMLLIVHSEIKQVCGNKKCIQGIQIQILYQICLMIQIIIIMIYLI